MPSIQVHTRAVETVLSGPAAGAIGVSYFGNIAGYDNLIGFDMGGTSTDVSVIVNGRPRVTSEGAIGGYPFALPIVDINTIGAGGGSIAWIDVAQGLHVGPESAGADPGPVCYTKGGSNPTITDANLCLGRLNNTYFLGGEMEVDKTASEKVILEKIGKPLGKDLAEACQGILDVANANMIRVIRVSSMEKGLDPRNFALMAFGGSGPVHAADVAEELSIGTVVVPREAGLLSAKGLLVTDHKNDYSMTRISRLGKTDKSDLISVFEALRLKAIADFEKDKMPTENIDFICSMDLRYAGQAYEINIPIIGEISDISFDKLEKDFNETHKRLYWWNDPERMLEIVNLRISAISEVPKVKPREDKMRGKDSHHAVKETRPVYFKALGGFDDTRIYARDQLQTGNEVGGPAVIESFDTTVIILPNHKAIIDAFGNIVIRTRSYTNG
jgi:N-methylhydantoinase A